LPMSTTPVLFLCSIRTWFLMIASSSLMRASMKPCSFFAAWYSKFSDRSPSSRAALILAAMYGRWWVTSWSCSSRTFSRPSGVMWTSLAMNPSLNVGGSNQATAVYSPQHEKAVADDRNAPHGHGPGGRRRSLPGRSHAPAPRPAGRHPHLGRRRGARDRAHGRGGQPLRQPGLGEGGHPVRVRRARLRGRRQAALERRVPHRPRHLRARLQPAPDRGLPGTEGAGATHPLDDATAGQDYRDHPTV